MIDERLVTEVVAKTFENAAVFAAEDGLSLLREAYGKETQANAKEALKAVLENIELAKQGHKSMCQTYATPGIQVYLGTRVNLNGTNVIEAVREGCRLATSRSFLRPSMVDPITRKPIGGNVGRYIPDIDVDLVADSDVMEVITYSTTTLPASRAWIWLPAEEGEGGINIFKAITERAIGGSSMLCPPIGVGVGIGGSLATAVKLTRKAFLRGWNVRNDDPQIAEWEDRLLGYINHLGIGPFGLGGDTFALAVNISNDVLKVKTDDDKKRVRYTRYAILFIGVITLSLSLSVPNIVNLAIILKAIGLALAPLVLFSWLTKGHKMAVIFSIIFSIIAIFISTVFGFIRPELAFVAIFTSVIVYLLTIMVCKILKVEKE